MICVIFINFLVYLSSSTDKMNINDPIFQRLRTELDQVRQELRQYKMVYRNERQDRRQLNIHCQNLQQNVADLNQNLENLRNELYDCREHINSFKVPKPAKKWENLISPLSRSNRKKQYRKCLDQSMIHLHEAKRARLQFRIGNEDVTLLWSENDLNQLRTNARNVVRPQIHRNVNDPTNQGNNSENEDEIAPSPHEPDPFLPDGSWNPIHLKRIVHVMDSFSISQVAYHELRMTSRSMLPPINRILKAKKAMSNTIKPLQHRTVNSNFNWCYFTNRWVTLDYDIFLGK